VKINEVLVVKQKRELQFFLLFCSFICYVI